MSPKRSSVVDGGDEDRTCVSAVRDEFRCSSFWLGHAEPRILASDQWGFPKLYVGWRVFWALYHLTWSMYDWINNATTTERPGTWLVYLTNWTFLLLTANTIVQATVVLHVTFGRSDLEDGRTPWYLKVAWLVYEMASAASIAVTVLYFVLLFDGTLSVISTVTHLLNTVYVILDVCVTAMPVRLLHVIYVAAYTVAYLVFSLIYWAADGVNSDGEPYIYETLDWSKPQRAAPVVVGAALVGVPLVHLLLWTLYMIRSAIHRNACSGQHQEKATTTNSKKSTNHTAADCDDCSV
ncbi:hypothetical protein BaRGS_00018174 [Batillaria attramentaria]|uniref:Protein rolling stone-like n=1 Tax=Batillaria attramentaria TaxID=370345 RepID=A0ABD0KTH5_9CAEN